MGKPRIEWRTLAMLALCYGVWAAGTTWASGLSLLLGIGVTTLATALHSSLSHEALHGHPTRFRLLNAALVFPALSLFIPYIRFRDQHIAHHNDPVLTDPYDDPETNFQDPAIWHKRTALCRALMKFNNTLAGRLLIGPLIGQIFFMAADWRAIQTGDRATLYGWLWHIPALTLVIWWLVATAQMPGWAYLLSAYIAYSILKIRTFLEHRAHETPEARTVIIADRGPFALLFLNNNYHSVHHAYPGMAWYDLPTAYAQRRADFDDRNGGYFYRNYSEIFRRYLFRAKDTVPHPLWSSDD